MTHSTRSIERFLGDWLRARLPHAVTEFVLFVLKLAWASIFGGLLLIAMILSRAIWQDTWPIHRFDVLFVYAVIVQVLFIKLRLEIIAEAKVIALFHLTGTVMEWFKVHAGSWDYPDQAFFEILNVPLYSGFMYASVGSFIARVIRVFDMRFVPFPPRWQIIAFAVAIYVNFFAHHFVWDMRYGLFAISIVLFARTRIWFSIGRNDYWMPLPLAAFLSSFFMWVAENVGQLTRTWVYSGHSHQDWVGFAKMGSWYLLLFVSLATVLSVYSRTEFAQLQRPKVPQQKNNDAKKQKQIEND